MELYPNCITYFLGVPIRSFVSLILKRKFDRILMHMTLLATVAVTIWIKSLTNCFQLFLWMDFWCLNVSESFLLFFLFSKFFARTETPFNFWVFFLRCQSRASLFLLTCNEYFVLQSNITCSFSCEFYFFFLGDINFNFVNTLF